MDGRNYTFIAKFIVKIKVRAGFFFFFFFFDIFHKKKRKKKNEGS